MLQNIKHSDGLQELLFFIFANPAKAYKQKVNRATQSKAPCSLSKRLIRALLIIIIMMLILSQISYAQKQAAHQQLTTSKNCNLLFFLQRDPDADTVVYELNYDSQGDLQQNTPIKGSWIRHKKKEKLEELTAFEKKLGYGVQSKSIGGGEYEIRLIAYKKMPMYLKKSETDNRYYMYIKDEGRNLLLKRMFVRVNGRSPLFPKVQYIDLITVNSAIGMEILKRIRT